jgi:1-deoxy-D-xylulose-5-phosphate synthase
MDITKLKTLAEELRNFIINNVSVTGGHLASNLGVIELTLGLHAVFDSPRDKIIFDVGHQSYVHKILTGRREQFSTLRQYGGISGFPKKRESIHDIFETGHSSTSISAALGIARARDIKGKDYHVIAVIGDGALTGGMAFEALNDAGRANTNLIVVLNDNEMSISRNVGALSTHLAKIRSSPRYRWVKKELEYILRKIPKAGESLYNLIERLKNSLKYFVVPGVIFEEMGFTYIGPIDGHNLSSILTMLNKAKEIQGPIFLHVVTKKGKGYSYAEEKPEIFHGVPPFCVETGKPLKKSHSLSYSKVFGRHLVDLAKNDPRIVAITAAMPEGTGLNTFKESFPQRFFDVGIAEQHAVTLAAGMASNGLRPIVAIYSTFLQRAYDQILHDVCNQNLPVILAIDRAGLVGEDGETHHGAYDISYLRHMPNITIMAPKNIEEMKAMVSYAFTLPGPTAIRYPKGCYGTADDKFTEPIKDLSWEILTEGRDIVLFAIGTMVETALRAAILLERDGFTAKVVNARIIKPLDTAVLQFLALGSNLWVTLEDNTVKGGFGSSINEYIIERGLSVRALNIGYPDRFIGHGSVRTLLKELRLDPEGIVERVRPILVERRERSYAGHI